MIHRRLHPLLLALLVAAVQPLLPAASSAGPDARLSAQDVEELRARAEARLGRPLEDDEILRRLRRSGLSADQVRSRLRDRGYEAGAAEPWLRAMEGSEERVPEGTDPLPILDVLTAAETDRGVGRIPAERPASAARREGADDAPEVFGRALFRRATSQFRPVTTGPVPPDYRLGPDDEIRLVLTGGVEQAYNLTVSPEGWIVIPDVGQVSVNGRTLAELEGALRGQLARVYSSVEDGSTSFDVSVGALRTNQVYVIGEVEQPAAYAVSSLATALTALYHAGGPTRNGSFRRVAVNRGGRTVATLDLYDYLLDGRTEDDVRLEQGDVVFVPLAGRRATITGPVGRPGVFELEDGETLADALRYAGGVEPTAELRRVQIQRILPADERGPGRDRTLLDVPVSALQGEEAGAAGEPVPVRDGDRITVFAVLDDVRNGVEVAGGVWRPGTYAVDDGTRLWDVLERAGGLLPDVYEGRAQIQRMRPDRTRGMIPVSLARDDDGRPLENPALEGMDQVFVYARRGLREGRVVSIGGWVRRPGTYPYVEGMTVRDLLLRAGGMRTGAYVGSAEVARVVISQTRTDTLTRRFEVPLDSSYAFAANDGGVGDGMAGAADEAASGEFPLRNLDAVYVRKSPGFSPQQTVVVTGEVLYEGPYSIRTRQDRLLDVIRSAGGLTPEAYPRGFQLWRERDPAAPGVDLLTPVEIAREGAGLGEGGADSTDAGAGPDGAADADSAATEADSAARRAREAARALTASGAGTVGGRTRVGVDFLAARDDPSSPANVLVEPGDSIHVPRYDGTVTVRGAVGVETKVLYREGEGLGFYIDQAGGYAEDAAEDRTRVRYANGEIETTGGGFLFFGGGVRDPDPGSTVFVPRKLERDEGISVQSLVGIVSSVASAAATIAIALTR